MAWWIYLLLPRREAVIGPLHTHQTAVGWVCCCWLHLKGKRGEEKKARKNRGKRLIGEAGGQLKRQISLIRGKQPLFYLIKKIMKYSYICDQQLQYYLLHGSVLSLAVYYSQPAASLEVKSCKDVIDTPKQHDKALGLSKANPQTTSHSYFVNCLSSIEKYGAILPSPCSLQPFKPVQNSRYCPQVAAALFVHRWKQIQQEIGPMALHLVGFQILTLTLKRKISAWEGTVCDTLSAC